MKGKTLLYDRDSMVRIIKSPTQRTSFFFVS
jgi:hypothetical protein